MCMITLGLPGVDFTGMVRFVMGTFNTTTANRADKNPEYSTGSDRQSAPVPDTLFKGRAADIVIHSGPHLGAFNAGILIPELIEASACMAAVCVAGKYWQGRYGENQGPNT